MATCEYCKYFKESPTIGKPDKKGRQWRRCIVEKRKMHMERRQCKYFDPDHWFFCDNYHMRLAIANCLNRRFNRQGFMRWQKCPKCRQFEHHIQHIVNDYIMNKSKKVLKPPHLKEARKIKRRTGKPKIVFNPDKKRKLKRSKKTDNPKTKRVLKRRLKPVKRKIKRRKK